MRQQAECRQRANALTGRGTLAEIAAQAGVWLPTVSKVVNGRPDVAAGTRARVERLLDEHRYSRGGALRDSTGPAGPGR